MSPTGLGGDHFVKNSVSLHVLFPQSAIRRSGDPASGIRHPARPSTWGHDWPEPATPCHQQPSGPLLTVPRSQSAQTLPHQYAACT